MVYWTDNTALEIEMGKKKDARKRREREAEQQAKTAGCGESGRAHKGSAPLAGIAAAIAHQMGTPAGRQMIAAGLMAAAGAIAGKESRSTGAKPVPPVEPKAEPDAAKSATGPFAGETPEPPRSEAPALPPEVSKIVDKVTTGLGRILAGLGKPAGDGAAPGTPPKR